MNFTDKQKRVYGPYFNGQDTVFGDPFAIYRGLQYHSGGDLNGLLADARATIPPQFDSEGKKISDEQPDESCRFRATTGLVEATAQAMGFKRLDPKTGLGATESDILGALNTFLEWLEGEK